MPLEAREAIVLVGGMGTRLKAVVSNVPKPLAPIAGVPFLSYLLKQLERQNFTKVILATGYGSEQIRAFCKSTAFSFQIELSHEADPLGTGGALRKAMLQATTESVFALNGDTYFPIDFQKLEDFHFGSSFYFSLALKKVINGNRYGSVILKDDVIERFVEKKTGSEPALINGGISLVRREEFLAETRDAPFSLEQDFYPRMLADQRIGGFEFHQEFIDIGIPEDFERAQILIPSLQP